MIGGLRRKGAAAGLSPPSPQPSRLNALTARSSDCWHSTTFSSKGEGRARRMHAGVAPPAQRSVDRDPPALSVLLQHIGRAILLGRVESSAEEQSCDTQP